MIYTGFQIVMYMDQTPFCDKPSNCDVINLVLLMRDSCTELVYQNALKLVPTGLECNDANNILCLCGCNISKFCIYNLLISLIHHIQIKQDVYIVNFREHFLQILANLECTYAKFLL